MRDIFQVKIAVVMTKLPRCIEPHQTVELARQWMDELKVKHLPVRESGKVVGIISDRDLGLTAGSKNIKTSTRDQKVEDAMISGVVSVSESLTVQEVAKQMVNHRVGSVVVLAKDGSLSGIFTDTDALKLLSGQF